jgi:hypothetical protein
LGPITTWLDRGRPTWRTDGFELIAQGSTPPAADRANAIARTWAEAGATWWIENDWESATVESQRRRIEAGPPRT